MMGNFAFCHNVFDFNPLLLYFYYIFSDFQYANEDVFNVAYFRYFLSVVKYNMNDNYDWNTLRRVSDLQQVLDKLSAGRANREPNRDWTAERRWLI